MAANKVKTLRGLLHELRKGLRTHESLRHSAAFSYVMDQYRRNAVTDQQYCRQQEEMAHLADTYLTYLESQRRYEELYITYHGKGERSVEETAKMVGFKMPNDTS